MNNVLKKIGHHLSDISNDSRHTKKNSLFLAYPGAHHDGRNYIEAAIKKGAKVILYEKKNFIWKKSWSVNHYPIENLKAKVSSFNLPLLGKPIFIFDISL